MINLIIDNKEALLGSAKIALSKSAYNLLDFTAALLNHSQALNLPRCLQNDKIFRYNDTLQSSKNILNQFFDFQLYESGSIVFVGICKVLEVNKLEYSIQLIDRSISAFNSLNADINKLVNIDLEDIYFTLTYFNILKNIDSGAWVWAANANNTDKQSTSIPETEASLKYSRPFLRADWILKKAFSDVRWTLNGDFTRFGLSVNHSDFFVCSYEKQYNISVSADYDFPLGSPSFSYNIVNYASYIDIGQTTTAFRFRGNIVVDGEVSIVINAASTTDADISEQTFRLSTGFVDITSEPISTSEANNFVSVSLLVDGSFSSSDFLIYTQISESDLGDLSTNPLLNYKIKTYDNLPEITQVDLFKELCTLAGYYFTTDALKKAINIKKYNALSTLNTSDFDAKLVVNTLAQKSVSDFAKENIYKYSTARGHAGLSSNNATGIKQKTVYTSDFEGSENVVVGGANLAYFGVYDATERVSEVGERVVNLELRSGIYVANFNDMNFSDVLLNLGIAKNALENMKIYECELILNRIDFYNFDFTKLVLIQGVAFFILELADYIQGQTTKAVLLKV